MNHCRGFIETTEFGTEFFLVKESLCSCSGTTRRFYRRNTGLYFWQQHAMGRWARLWGLIRSPCYEKYLPSKKRKKQSLYLRKCLEKGQMYRTFQRNGAFQLSQNGSIKFQTKLLIWTFKLLGKVSFGFSIINNVYLASQVSTFKIKLISSISLLSI